MYTHHIAVIRRLIRAGGVHRAEKVLEKIPPRDLPQVLSALEKSEARLLAARLVTPARVRRGFRQLPLETREALLAPLDDDYIRRVLERVPPGPRDALLAALPAERAESLDIPGAMGKDSQRSAAQGMGPAPLALRADVGAQSAIDAIRESENPSHIFYLYVIDGAGYLTGVVPLRRLVTALPGAPLSSLMTPRPLVVHQSSSLEAAAQIIADHGLLALPVVGDNRELLGLIRTDDIFEFLAPAAAAPVEEVAPAAPDPKAPAEVEESRSWGQWLPFWSARRPRNERGTKAAWVGLALLSVGASAMGASFLG